MHCDVRIDQRHFVPVEHGCRGPSGVDPLLAKEAQGWPLV